MKLMDMVYRLNTYELRLTWVTGLVLFLVVYHEGGAAPATGAFIMMLTVGLAAEIVFGRGYAFDVLPDEVDPLCTPKNNLKEKILSGQMLAVYTGLAAICFLLGWLRFFVGLSIFIVMVVAICLAHRFVPFFGEVREK